MKKHTPGPVIMGINPEHLVETNTNIDKSINRNNKPPSNFKSSLAELLAKHNPFNVDGSPASHATQDKYADVLYAGFGTLRELGYKLGDVHGFRGKHMVALTQDWERQFRKGQLSASTLQNRISIFRVFSGWIGKSGMVEVSHKYVSPECVKRTTINTTDKSWSAYKINIAN